MTNFVWFYGPTAVGKDTLIHRISEDSNHPLIPIIGLESPLYIHEEAMRLRHQERNDIAKSIEDTRHLGRSILIKAQGHDMGLFTPLVLKERLPNDRHIIVYLDADPEIIRERRIKRGQQPPTWDDVNDRRINLNFARDIENAGMELIWLNNNDNIPIPTSRPIE